MSQRSASNPRNTTGEKTGAIKRSAARAKPKSAAASTVRMATSEAKSGGRALTKEERKRAEHEERNARNRNAAATNVLLKKDPEYARGRVVWGVVLVVGLALTILSWVVLLLAPEDARSIDAPMGKVSIACLVLAYVCVIGSFIFDWVKLRKQRMAMEEKVNAMSDRRIDEILRDEAFARAAKKKQGLFGRAKKEVPAPSEEGSE